MSSVQSQAMIVISANIEGLTGNKEYILSELCKKENCHCLCLQETHRAHKHARPTIAGMTLVAERPHNKYGSAVFIRTDLKVKSVSVSEEENVELITVELPGVIVQSVYKPHKEDFVLPTLGHRNLPHIVIGDFNSHSTTWGYTTTDNNGNAVEHWAESCELTLIHNAKLPKSFNSARWKKGYNPDLIFASSNIANMCEKSVMEPIPNTQHRPICIRVNPVVVAKPTPFRRRFNLRKADWNGYSTQLDTLLEDVDPIPENYVQFVEAMRVASRKNIPRGCRTQYIPGLTEESKSLYEAYKEQYSSNPFGDTTIEAGTKLVDNMTAEKKKRWEEVITSTDLTHNSRKAWKTIKKLSNDPTSSNPPCLVTANQVAHQLLVNGRGTMPSKPRRPILPTAAEGVPSLVYPFSEEEYKKGIATLKNNKAAGRDDMLVEQLKNLGPESHKWLLTMLNKCFMENKIPKIWRQSRIIAILKPGKDSAIPKNYRPISLLCHTYKLYERLILNRIAPTVERHLIKEQAGFRPGKSCTSQLLNLTQHIEDGYQKGMITGAAFVDLSAAYDTVNHRILLQKLYNTTQDSTLCRVFQNMLSNRRFYVELNNERSRWRNQKNGLPQGSVLSPILFNIYTNDQPLHDGTRSFIYADDLCVTAQHSSFEDVERTIEVALGELTQYYRENSLRANPDKTQVTAFHLRNKEATRSLKVAWNRIDLENTTHPKYLGVTLDRTLSYKQHIHNTKMKVATRNNLLKKLANSKWGTNASTIRTTALALCYSVAEYASPVWERSKHTSLLDPELNQACRSITGCLKPTNVEDLYLLAGIAPPDIRRNVCARMERAKQIEQESHSLFGQTPAQRRLKSRSCFLTTVQPAHFPPKVIRCSEWQRRLKNISHHGAANLHENLAVGHDSPWTTWRCLNRLRTGYTCSKEQRKKWGYYDGDTTCECGQSPENTNHMLRCPLLTQSCTLDDLAQFNNAAKQCVDRWKKMV